LAIGDRRYSKELTHSDMGNRAAVLSGAGKAPITLDESIAGCVKVIDGASREKWSGLHMR
jgi:norsolorinic acid ketoreductase